MGDNRPPKVRHLQKLARITIWDSEKIIILIAMGVWSADVSLLIEGTYLLLIMEDSLTNPVVSQVFRGDHQTCCYQHSRYRRCVTSPYGYWLVSHAPWSRQCARSGTHPLEACKWLRFSLAMMFRIYLSAEKGLIWLFLATLAAIPNTVRLPILLCPSSFLISTSR